MPGALMAAPDAHCVRSICLLFLFDVAGNISGRFFRNCRRVRDSNVVKFYFILDILSAAFFIFAHLLVYLRCSDLKRAGICAINPG